ncbi:hypothetical protein Q3G72_033474 [Acer saccharum]|nr:hypothetical protein Q3G72_024396 [Acer saccharum]KAK1548645.1 hypothetical protein Q3G72_033474 [Acer saccharum]
MKLTYGVERIQAKFWSKVEKTASCWLWRGGSDGKNRYGRFYGGKIIGSAHRMSYVMHKGAIPHGYVVRHSCHKPLCVNPDHLSVGTAKDNTKDMLQAGRGRFRESEKVNGQFVSVIGSNNPSAKITEEQVLQMRYLYDNGLARPIDLVKEFGVSNGCVYAEVRSDPQPTWLVEGFIPSDNLVLISGHPKDSKKTWLGMWLALQAAEKHKICYIYREGSRLPTLQRFDALTQSLRVDTREYLYNQISFHHRNHFWLDNLEQVKNACKFIKRNDIKLIFVDTFAKSVQSDENSSKDVGKAINATERLRDAGATVVLVHHLRKATSALSNGAQGTPEPDKDLRGSSALAGAYETHLAVRAYDGKPSILLVGGKETEWTAYDYDWQFKADENKQLIDARLHLKLTDIPNIGSNDDE